MLDIARMVWRKDERLVFGDMLCSRHFLDPKPHERGNDIAHDGIRPHGSYLWPVSAAISFMMVAVRRNRSFSSLCFPWYCLKEIGFHTLISTRPKRGRVFPLGRMS